MATIAKKKLVMQVLLGHGEVNKAIALSYHLIQDKSKGVKQRYSHHFDDIYSFHIMGICQLTAEMQEDNCRMHGKQHCR